MSFPKMFSPQGRFPLTKRVFGIWKTRAPPQSAYPLDPDLATAIAAMMVYDGNFWGGVLVLLCFGTLMGVVEGLGLRWGNLFFPREFDLPGSIYFGAIKANQEQHVPLMLGSLLILMRVLRDKYGKDPASRIFRSKYHQFRFWFRSCPERLGSSVKHFRSHSMRRGGATWML